MELFFEILGEVIEVIFEIGLEVGMDNKVKKGIRYPILVLVLLAMAAIWLVLFLGGIYVLGKNVVVGVVLILIAAGLLGVFLYKMIKLWEAKRDEDAEKSSTDFK